MNTETLPAYFSRQAPAGPLPTNVLVALAGMELVNQYILGHLTLNQTNELLAAHGHRRVLTIIEKRMY